MMDNALECVLSQFQRHAGAILRGDHTRATPLLARPATKARRQCVIYQRLVSAPTGARLVRPCNTASSSMMVMRVLPVAGKTSRNGRNSANCAAVSSGLSSSGVPARGAASTARPSRLVGAGSDAFSF